MPYTLTIVPSPAGLLQALLQHNSGARKPRLSLQGIGLQSNVAGGLAAVSGTSFSQKGFGRPVKYLKPLKAEGFLQSSPLNTDCQPYLSIRNHWLSAGDWLRKQQNAVSLGRYYRRIGLWLGLGLGWLVAKCDVFRRFAMAPLHPQGDGSLFILQCPQRANPST